MNDMFKKKRVSLPKPITPQERVERYRAEFQAPRERYSLPFTFPDPSQREIFEQCYIDARVHEDLT